MYLIRLMLVGVWLGLLWVLFYFFGHYIQSSFQFISVIPSASVQTFILNHIKPFIKVLQ